MRRLPARSSDEPAAPRRAAWHVERHDPPHLVIPPRPPMQAWRAPSANARRCPMTSAADRMARDRRDRADQPGDRQSAGGRHPAGAVVPFGAGLYRLPAAPAVRLRRPALPVARLSDRRRTALVRLRPVLRLAGRLPDVVFPAAVRAVHLAEPDAQGAARLSGRPAVAAGPAVRRGGDLLWCRWRITRPTCRARPIPSLADFWRHWRQLPFWPSGPMWFLWILLVGDLLAAGIYPVAGRRRDRVLRLSILRSAASGAVSGGPGAGSRRSLCAAGADLRAVGLGAARTVRVPAQPPVALRGYFLAGVAIGACGIERGLFAPDGPLVRRWRRWLASAPPLFFAWAGTTALTLPGPAPRAARAARRFPG